MPEKHGHADKDKGKQSSLAKLLKSALDFVQTLTGALITITGLVAAIAGLWAALHGFGPKPDEPQDHDHGPTTVNNDTNHNEPSPHPLIVTACTVSGAVYDKESLVPLPGIPIAYVSSARTNAPSTQIATTDPHGEFQFPCTQIAADDFPIHLRMTYTWSGGSQIVESADQIFVTGNPKVNLYLSPKSITNWHQLHVATIMRVPSAELLRNYSTVSISNNVANLPAEGISVVPANIRVSRNLVIPR